MSKHPIIAMAVLFAFIQSAVADEQRSADAVGVFHCTFGEDSDVNYDRWPDRWVRKAGPDYPHYVNMELNDDGKGGRCLQIDLDGAAASISSPPIRVISRFGYRLDVMLKNERLEHSTVVVHLDFYDANGRLLQSEKSKPIGTTAGWQQVSLGRVEPIDARTERAVVGFVVERGQKGDLQGRVSLGDIWLERSPRISVTTNNPFCVYTDVDDVIVNCVLSGIRERTPEIRFQLLDSRGVERAAESVRLDGRLIAENEDSHASTDGAGTPAGYEGSARWQPHIPGFGYYRIVVKMLSSEATGGNDLDRELDSRDVWLAVVPPLDMPMRGEFGWTLPEGDKPLELDHLSRLLPQVGINWVKLPVWYDAADSRRGDELIRFVELLGASNVEVVGIIDRPPAGSNLASRTSGDAPVSEVLALESAPVWSPRLEPVMTRLALRVRWWQLGGDNDTSFAGSPDVSKRIEALRRELFRFGQDVRLGIGWDWQSESRAQGKVGWDFQQNTSSAVVDNRKLIERLAQKRENSALRWVIIEPPLRAEGPAAAGDSMASDQYRQFVMDLVAAKQHGADGIFISNPFNDNNGLMRANGMPAELLLPWRTTAAMLGGAEFLGSMPLPGGTENRIFLRPDGKVVMVVWSSNPTEEVLYLGKEIRQFDIYGHATSPRIEGNAHVIPVGPLPSFVLGLHEAITRWRMALSFDNPQLPSVYGKNHPNSIRIHNFFPQGVGGTFSIVVPQEEGSDAVNDGSIETAESADASGQWTIDPQRATFKIARNEDFSFPFEIRLKNAMYGKHPIRVDFEVEADEHYVFSAYRELEVGTGDLTIHVNTFLDKDGSLVVHQVMTNLSDNRADFKCYLYGGKRPQRMQVYRLGKEDDHKFYRYPNGTELLDNQMLLEIEEIGGEERVIQYRFKVTDSPENEVLDGAKGTADEQGARRDATP
jgi:hypothetical protein